MTAIEAWVGRPSRVRR